MLTNYFGDTSYFSREKRKESLCESGRISYWFTDIININLFLIFFISFSIAI